MRISHKHKFIFFALPRTGSTTTRDVLDQYSDIKSRHITEVTRGFPFYHHIPAKDLKQVFLDKGWDWDSYIKFCVVRNPWDRAVSLYHHHHTLAKEARNQKFIKQTYMKLKSIAKPTEEFSDYIRTINPNNKLEITLHNFIFDGDECLVDNVLHFEHLDTELPAILEKIGIDTSSLKIPHLNASGKRDSYKGYYSDSDRQLIEKLYGYEITKYDYEF